MWNKIGWNKYNEKQNLDDANTYRIMGDGFPEFSYFFSTGGYDLDGANIKIGTTGTAQTLGEASTVRIYDLSPYVEESGFSKPRTAVLHPALWFDIEPIKVKNQTLAGVWMNFYIGGETPAQFFMFQTQSQSDSGDDSYLFLDIRPQLIVPIYYEGLKPFLKGYTYYQISGMTTGDGYYLCYFRNYLQGLTR